MSTVKHPLWTQRANIYQVNIRQYTPQGTLAAFAEHLPRLKAMGVDILWLMPIQPIGVKARKGTLGSNYAVSDYKAVNPEFGTLDDFRQLVAAVHDAGLYLILDWVANHTAWDHAWVVEHPGWYKRNAQGEIDSCEYDNGREIEHWTDVIGLDYTQDAVWTAMTEAMCFWVRETGIDGFRCDVASLVPTPFWEQAREALEAIKPVFMLAESDDPALHRKAFDMSYDWALYDAMTKIAAGRGDVNDLVDYLDRQSERYPEGACRMTFTTNHDKNAWEGHDGETFGASFKVFAVLAATLPGMPLIYGGQEAGLDKRLQFFEKDAIEWKTLPLASFYAGLLQLKHDHAALWNGEWGGDVELLPQSSTSVFAFRRRRGDRTLTVVANLSSQAHGVALDPPVGSVTLDPWGYCLV